MAPSAGVVVRWRIRTATFVAPVALRITRPGSSTARTGAGTGPVVTPTANTISTFSVSLPIAAGDAIGIDCCGGQSLEAFGTTPGAFLLDWQPRLEDGEAPRVVSFTHSLELLVNADIEPDADCDGLGDETQDPGVDPNGCDQTPPDTTITAGPGHKTKKKRVTFEFTSNEPGSTFECSVDDSPFAPCSSPHEVSVKKGRHTFAVRAIDPGGNVDPLPASSHWRFKKKRKK